MGKSTEKIKKKPLSIAARVESVAVMAYPAEDTKRSYPRFNSQ